VRLIHSAPEFREFRGSGSTSVTVLDNATVIVEVRMVPVNAN
jgi:hypothetical protein